MPAPLRRALERWAAHRLEVGGPAAATHAIADGIVAPLWRLFGYEILRRPSEGDGAWLLARTDAVTVPVLVVPWRHDLGSAWRLAVVAGVAADGRWCACTNGVTLRVHDAHRTWARDYLEIQLEALGDSGVLQDACWTLLRAHALSATPPTLDQAVAASARHGVDVCRTLGTGVLGTLQLLVDAMSARSVAASRTGSGCIPNASRIHPERVPNASRTHPEPAGRLFEQALTVVYRVLFLLFAEARALVPIWHPVYRDRYTIEGIVATLLGGGACRGIWAAVQAISRLAHAGCTAGELKVTAFNGRLFAPAHAAAFDRRKIADPVMAKALLSLTAIQGRSGLERIRYRDLDVEQLGAVYEKVLEYEPRGPSAVLERDRDGRKASGTFYTPRQVTAFLVRRTLAPLVRTRTADEILALRIVDPAMGSGAFLVAACRFLASAVEDALIREGKWHPGDVSPADRAELRREVAQRCLYGVDLNPVAVQLARLSLWLATLASDKPLTFLDHHLAVGNSLVGAGFEDVARQPGGSRRAGRRSAALPLFDEESLAASLRDAVSRRSRMALHPDDTVADVRDKERELAGLQAPGSTLGRWRRLLDVWCAGWFAARDERIDTALAGELRGAVLHGHHTLPRATVEAWLARTEAIATSHRFFHWPVAFPEVFRADDGAAAASGGFDAVIGNPPWDMVRGDSGERAQRDARRDEAHKLTAFIREAGIYRLEAQAHVNRYALFVERAFQLVRPGGRIGLVLPSGLVTDVGTAALRRHLLERVDVDEVTGVDNRGGIFPIHRSVRFVLMSGTYGRTTDRIACRFGISRIEELEADGARTPRLELTRAFLARVSSADDLGIPELESEQDLRLLEHVSATVPRLGDEDGWNIHFGRELNATDDRGLFEPWADNGSRPVLEGKQIEPFRVSAGSARFQLRRDAVVKVPQRSRLAYRDVASATNRLTLIAAIVPARAVTTHTLFCLREPLRLGMQHVLCALLNSFVANYLMRLRVNTHVTATLMSKLRVPVVDPRSPQFAQLATLARTLADGATPVDAMEEYAELQACVARLYGLTPSLFEHILSTFPLIPETVRAATATLFGNAPQRH